MDHQPDHRLTPPSRRAAGLGAAAVLLVLAVVVTLVVRAAAQDDESPTPSADPAPPTSSSPSPTEDAGPDLRARAKPFEAKRPKTRKSQPAPVDSPFAERPWGNYQGNGELAWPPYAAASGANRELLGRIALTPKAMWFGHWTPPEQIGPKITDYLANAQGGDPDALVQMTFFRLQPWDTAACQRAPSAAEQAGYRAWMDNAAAAIGDTPTAIVLQPDLPFALCSPGGPAGPATQLVAYAAERLSALPNTSVYIEAGASDWPAPGQGGVEKTLEFLIPAGIEHARGFALGSTHFASTENEVQRAADLSDALAARGMPGKKAVINTSSNGHPFDFGAYRGSGVNAIGDNARICTTPNPAPSDTCLMLGIPPTAEVDAERWQLPEETRAQAREHVDAYLWFGRPWLYWQNQPFQLERALPLAQHWPWAAEAGY